MRRPTRRLAASLLLSLVVPGLSSAAEDFTFHHENVMGTTLELRVRADSAAAARGAEARALAEIERLSAVLSAYDATSAFRRWQAGPRGAVKVPPELFEVLDLCDQWRERSSGAFEPRIELLTRLWSRAAREGREPTPKELSAATYAFREHEPWRLDRGAGTASRVGDLPSSLDGIAKGYIVEKACAAALDAKQGVRGLVLNVGGDLRVVGDLTRRVEIAAPGSASETTAPVTTIEVRDRALATSGRAHRGFAIQGRWYSHIIDPRTGRPAEAVASATVLAKRSADADALATLVNVLGVEEGLTLVQSFPGAECLIQSRDGRVVRSAGWSAFEAAPPPVAGTAARNEGGGGNWGDAYELVVDFEINQPAGSKGQYRRPYVAIWVENAEGYTARTLLLWLSQGGSGFDRWLPDLKRWHRSDLERQEVDKSDLAHTISQPTRAPGRYSTVWDGKDDHGKPLPGGEYMLSIEAAREHGTYQIIRRPITIGGTPFAEELKGNVEIKSARVEYRRKAPPR